MEGKENSSYENLFKNLLSKESNYEFFLKAQLLLKKELKKNPNSSNYISLLIYCINHLKESDDKQSVNTLLDYALEQYIKKNTILPEGSPKQEFLQGFLKAFNDCNGLFATHNFRVKFLYYCKKNKIDEKNLKLNKCYDIFAKGCMSAKEYVDAYTYCIKSENINLLFELFDEFEKLSEMLKTEEGQKDKENPLYNYKLLFKKLDEEELNILILRAALELIINKKIELAFEFIGKYYNKKENNIIINFAYNLVCLMIRKPHGFDDFWSLINIYKLVIDKRFDIQNYLNQIIKFNFLYLYFGL